MKNGYYWIENVDGTQFIALLAKGAWWLPGLENPVFFSPSQILWPVPGLGVTSSLPLENSQRFH